MRKHSHGEINFSKKDHRMLALDAIESSPSVGFMFENLISDPQNLLPESQTTVDAITALGNAMANDPSTQEGTIPAAYTYFGQFIDHDITKTEFDSSLLLSNKDPIEEAQLKPIEEAQLKNLVKNIRTLTFDLDSLYGGFAVIDPTTGRMKLSEVFAEPSGGIKTHDKEHDLPRRAMNLDPQTEKEIREDREALIGDPRNDENLIVAQLHVAFIRAHNQLIERGLSFSEAQMALRRRYQWAVLHDFLPRISDPTTFNDIITNEARFWTPQNENDLFMPLEHSVAAYRFGHSMVRGEYFHNIIFNPASFKFFFTFTALSGDISRTDGHSTEFPTLPDNWIIDWARFFESEEHENSMNPARRIDTNLTPELGKLRNNQGDPFQNLMAQLATRNLRRGYLLRIPTGQAIAKFINVQELDSNKILETVPDDLKTIISNAELDKRTPLWFYILAEAGDSDGPNGNHLGAVGSRIIGETFWNALKFSKDSVITTPPTIEELETGEFSLKGIIQMGLDKNLTPLIKKDES